MQWQGIPKNIVKLRFRRKVGNVRAWCDLIKLLMAKVLLFIVLRMLFKNENETTFVWRVEFSRAYCGPLTIWSKPAEPVAVITLRARAPRKKVVWTDDTVDNEHMNKKKSKCCCIYEKPKKFGESDSEDSDDECEHCFGHVEKRHAKLATDTGTTTDVLDGPTPEATATITLQPPPEPEPTPPPTPAGIEPAPTPPEHKHKE